MLDDICGGLAVVSANSNHSAISGSKKVAKSGMNGAHSHLMEELSSSRVVSADAVVFRANRIRGGNYLRKFGEINMRRWVTTWGIPAV